MKPFKKILVPVDFSPHADEAIRYAADLSRRYEAAVTLVHVYELVAYPVPDGFVLFTPDQVSGLLGELERQLRSTRGTAESLGAVRVDTKVVQGRAHLEILDLAEHGAYDLIVMGTHGRTGVKHALVGSVAEKVVRKAPCPVMTVRAAD